MYLVPTLARPRLSEATTRMLKQSDKERRKDYKNFRKFHKYYEPYTKPQLRKYYNSIIPRIKKIANELGYAVAIHGSKTRDLDVMAMPWVKEAKAPETLAIALMREFHLLGDRKQGDGYSYTRKYLKEMAEKSNKPHGRRAYSLPVKGRAYIDLSVMPRSVDKVPK